MTHRRHGIALALVGSALSTAAVATAVPVAVPAAPRATAASGAAAAAAAATQPATRPAVRFNTNFEGGSLGKVEAVGPDAYRLHVAGQYDERGHNRQTSWFFVRLDGVAGRPLTLTLTDLVGEYNDRPGAIPFGPDIVPVWSADRRTWTHFKPGDEAVWDGDKKELTLRFTPTTDAVWVAHIPPYVPADLARLLEDVGRSPAVLDEVVGRTPGGRDLHLLTLTDRSVADAGKRCVWLQARQHAWEAGTSWAMDGAVRFLASDDPAAAAIRQRVVFRFTPMADPDGAAAGRVRFNANGYDLNRHWPAVDLRDPEQFRLMPETWYVKRAIAHAHASGPPVDLLVNLHNTETGEYLQTFVDDGGEVFARFRRLYDGLVERSGFDPSTPLAEPKPKAVVKPPADTTNSLWATHRVPAALMELRVGTVKKLGRRRTVADWQRLGRELVIGMAEAVQ